MPEYLGYFGLSEGQVAVEQDYSHNAGLGGISALRGAHQRLGRYAINASDFLQYPRPDNVGAIAGFGVIELLELLFDAGNSDLAFKSVEVPDKS